MLGYRKRSFADVFGLLENLRANQEDLASLKQLQLQLLLEIVRTEKRIRKLKADLRSLRETGGEHLAKRTAYLQKRIEGYRQCAYIWRCFGDAIAFLYMDKHALKQVLFNVENSSQKNDAGFIVGKEGLISEIAFLDYAFKQQVPAILTDLTNTIRHGDICLMGGPDPYLIEIKASKKLDQRGKKQKRNLDKLHQFFENDKIENLRGFKGEIRRQAYQTPERTYVLEMNDCVSEALIKGYATRTPEPGLHYIGLSRGAPSMDTVMAPFKLKSIWFFNLNEVKSSRSWSPYTPFTLTILSKDHLWEFVRGNVIIFVVLELDALCAIAKQKGYDATLDRGEDDAPSFRILIPEVEGFAGPSSFTLARIGMEFVSPNWLVTASIEMLNTAAQRIRIEAPQMVAAQAQTIA